ncbi:hypothetical protein D8B22_19135, partial [Verminephrobacter aporrectodeae subsp. tuberculatae]|uniref:LPD7 domain-containing protein n=1 Tax=Verminephrobacter aporrectodeae TaxID=1110389 RepID=UPI002ADD499D
MKELLTNDKLPLAHRLDTLGQELLKRAQSGRVLTQEERATIANLAETGMATKVLEISGDDSTTRDANRVLEPQQFAAMSVARSLAAQDAQNATNPFKNEQLRHAYTSERAFMAHLTKTAPDQFAEQSESTTTGRAAPAAAEQLVIRPTTMEHLARTRAADREAVEKQLGLNTVGPDIEREHAQLDGAQAAKRDAWVKKAPTIDAGGQPTAVDTAFKGNQVESDEIFTAQQQDNRPVVPPEIERQYLRVGSKFYHPKNTDLVAFEDKGNKLETRSNSERIAKNLVRIAQSRGWDEIKVSGSETFRREAWLEAAARGMHVKGYTPSDQDLAALAKLQGDMQANRIEQGKAPFRGRENETGDKLTPSAGQSTTAPQTKNEQHERNAAGAKLIAGVIVAHGAAKYLHDEKHSASYFVTVRDDKGAEKTSWGVDLERAMKNAGAKVGDNVTLENEGSKQVTVTVPVRDGRGRVIGSEEKETHRVTTQPPGPRPSRSTKARLNRSAQKGLDERVKQLGTLLVQRRQ